MHSTAVVRFIAASVLAVLCLAPGSQAPARLTADDAAVFRAVVRHQLAGAGAESRKPRKLILLRTTLRQCKSSERGHGCLPNAMNRVSDSAPGVWDRSLLPQPLPDLQESRVVFASAERLDRLFASVTEGWLAFHRAYPGADAIVRLSMPSFSNGEAVLYVDVASGNIAGSGLLLHLTMKDGEWVVRHREVLWVS